MSTRNSRTTAIAGVALLILLSGGLVALLALSDDDDDVSTSAVETAPVEIVGDPLPRFSPADAAIGLTAPTVRTSTIDGTDAELRPDGPARLIGFVAHWCSHCQRELPSTVRWLDDNDLPDDVEIVLISTAVDENADNYPPSAWFAREGWEGTALVDDVENTAAAAFGLSAFPFWVAVDADGTVVQRLAGELTNEQFEALLGTIS